ncbi:hypothetical protein [Microtetraspora sp. NBRC 16547]|uniref:hypothetical protein n=1 Tax=Microtetraspora sp. NBRC 16547 TaxID=3030993 RepID=UPI0024A545E0|nr:hypothetical protein [Microtetraspora sp. NBRC 16547]GLX02771.1 hypothetical protein Misp02_68570 [Microtetraspora sp. NBRC 16547]
MGDEEGIAYYRAEMNRLSAALMQEGVTWRHPEEPAWRGPESTPPFMRSHAASFSYGYLHYLRRVFALMRREEPVTPISSQEELSRDDYKVKDETLDLYSHLLCHSDCDGYYVPVDFYDPLFLPDDAGISGGGMVGSSHRLLAELRECAPVIGIQIEEDGSLSDAEASRVFTLPEDAPFEVESVVWLALHEACRASIATGCAVNFH